jgi:hypothetical protein
MKVMNVGAAVLIFGIATFIFSSGWQAGLNDQWATNWAGQTCHSALCIRPEWIGLGAAGMLASAVVLFLSLRPGLRAVRPRVQPTGTNVAAVPRRINALHASALGLVAIAALGMGVVNYGTKVTGSITRPGQCSADTPVEITVRNNTFQTASALLVAVELVPLGRAPTTRRQLILEVKGPISPLSAGVSCFSIDGEAPQAIESPASESDDLVRVDATAALDRVDAAIKFGKEHRIEVRLLRGA